MPPPPDRRSLRGPAPIHHAILQGRTHTGVSLQTLDEKAFDHGTVLSQTPAPGIPVSPTATVQELIAQLAPVGAQMLVQGLRDGVHVPPRRAAGWTGKELEGEELVHAPKVNKADGQVDWARWTGQDFSRRVRVLGSAWTRAVNKRGEVKRLIIQDAEIISGHVQGRSTVSFVQNLGEGEDSKQDVALADLGDGSCAIELSSGEQVRVKTVKEEGKPDRDAASVFTSYSS